MNSGLKVFLASDEQLKFIISHDKDCPNHLLEQVVEEMIRRRLFDNLIFYAANLVYKHVNSVLYTILKIDREELYHIGHIEIMIAARTFKQGLRTFKSFIIMVLKMKFKKLVRDAHAHKRTAHTNSEYMDNLDEKMHDIFFQSKVNVEQQVVEKITIEEQLSQLRDVERKAIELEIRGYSQYEISRELNFNLTYAHQLLDRAYKKIQKRSVVYV